ncbi:hypothetical protein C8A03DRAFT_31457 [Achaetomium macrosporum]|uniref:Retrotransposon gag domain-containing protein n=1 Tax=Achaetomium macrosporum TaxID=79813 RepID=A0AAN7CEQ2_9PEZI|nr:hypothetical protein C8A03DRAFT_31457 [Achaetomium macrosporum]
MHVAVSGLAEGFKPEAARRMVHIRFRNGLRGAAKDWWRHEYAGDRRDYQGIEKAFLGRFSASPAADDAVEMAQAASFERKEAEALPEYLRRGEALHREMRSKEAKCVLAIRLVSGLSAHGTDASLRARVIDRLFASGKVVSINGSDFLSPYTTFNDVYNVILACAHGVGETEDEHPNDNEDIGMNPVFRATLRII